jgi:uncharacterized repeat protein (TIGR03803 family)
MIFTSRLFLIVLLALLVGSPGAHASRLASLYSFCSEPQGTRCLDGKEPSSRLLELNGVLFGATAGGGSKLNGTLFKIATNGTFTTIHTFCQSLYCGDGSRPGNYLTADPKGTIYGVTLNGGQSDGGTIFKMSIEGVFSLVHKFCGQAQCLDGAQPISVLYVNGNLIGTAAAGGSHGSGTAFSIDSGGTLHVLHNFCSEAGCADGISPGPLVRGKDGNFYGTTSAGGKNHAGTVFRMTPAGGVTVLYAFCAENNCADGQQAAGPLVQGANGDFYGTTALQGAHSRGTIFEISPAGVFRALYSFCRTTFCRDGATPTDGLIRAKDGSFYGVASGGGLYYYGVVFHLTAAGSYNILYNFCIEHGCFDGAGPGTSPIFGNDGLLYGVTGAGGDKDNTGTVYRLEP